MAIDDLLDEHEQSERVRNWLRANSAGLIIGVGLGLGAIYGWMWWKDQVQAKRLQASDSYQTIQEQVKAGKLKDAQAKAAALKDSAYATLAALDLAKAQVDGGQRDAAIVTLRGAVADANFKENLLAPIVNQRLAQLMIDAGKGEEALKLIAAADDAGALEIRGDALFALGRRDQARDAYGKALAKLDVAAPQRRLVELKLSQSGGKPPKHENAS